jgi:hypothetical protein
MEDYYLKKLHELTENSGILFPAAAQEAGVRELVEVASAEDAALLPLLFVHEKLVAPRGVAPGHHIQQALRSHT